MSNLIPVKRPDKNGKIVTRYVRPGTGSATKSLPAPSFSRSSDKERIQEASKKLTDAAFITVDGAVCDIYEIEIPDPERSLEKISRAFNALPIDVLSGMERAWDKSEDFSAREIVANTIYRLGDSKGPDQKAFKLIAVHLETIVDLMNNEFPEFRKYEPLTTLYGTVRDCVISPLEGVNPEDHALASITLTMLSPEDDFNANRDLVRNMFAAKDAVTSNWELVKRNLHHVRERGIVDPVLLSEIESHHNAIGNGAL